MKRLIFLLLAIPMATGCIYDIDEILLDREDVSMTVKGEEQFVYDPMTCQLGYNEDDNEYRIINDDLGDWFVVRCSHRPTSSGQEIKADVTWTTENDIKTRKGLKFTVRKTSPDGLIWMWCKSEKMGVTIKEI